MESEVRLTRAQTWELVRMSAAAVISTIFFSIPLFLARPDGKQTAAAPAIRQEVMTAGVTQPEPTDAAVVPAVASVSVVQSTMVADVTTPVLQQPGGRGLPATTEAKRRSDSPAAFGRRLGRFLAGTGKYEVKPFPTVNTPGS